MAARYGDFYQQMMSLLDSVSHDSDPLARLANLQQLNKDFRRTILARRDEAAYDLRMKYSCEDAEALSGVSRRHIDYWAQRWRRSRALPALKRISRVDLSGAIDLTGDRRFPFTRPR